MTIRVGLIGCGNISTAYLDLAPTFPALDIVAVADLSAEAAAARGAQYKVDVLRPDELIASADIDLVLNLTIPTAHADVSGAALDAGKHVYTEKPVTTRLEDGQQLVEKARRKGLLFCSAPDTFLGGAPQLARRIIDEGTIGRVVAGTAHMMTRGVEHRHPNPFFFFQDGGGPILDMGPYYLTQLVNLFGPIERVIATGSIGRAEREITFAASPFVGQKITVETETTVHAALVFRSGVNIGFTASWDVLDHGHRNLEFYGTEGSLFAPDPNFFGGDVLTSKAIGAQSVVDPWDHPFSVINWTRGDGKQLANYRGVGLADMAHAIAHGSTPRCDASLGVHVLDALQSILQSAREGRAIVLDTTCERPAPLDPAAARQLLAS